MYGFVCCCLTILILLAANSLLCGSFRSIVINYFPMFEGLPTVLLL